MSFGNISSYAAALVVTSALGGGLAVAADPGNQGASPSQSSDAAQLKGHDREFFNKAAQGGLMEVEAAKLAMERASSADVKSFAQTLQRDHAAANQKLAQIAQQKGLQVPTQLDGKHKQELDKLARLKGEEFDKAFMKDAGMKDHKQDIQLFERQAREGNDPQLKSFAQETLPTLHSHMQMAQKITGGGHAAQSDAQSSGSSASKEQGGGGKQQ